MQRLQQPRKTCQMQERLPAALLTLQSSLLPYQTPWNWSMCYCPPGGMVILWRINDCQKATIPVSRGQRWSLRGFWGMGDAVDSPMRSQRSVNLQTENLKKRKCQARLRKFNSDGTSILISIEAIKEHLGKNQDFCRDFRGSHQSISIRVKERDKKYLKKLEFITKYLEDTWIFNKIPGKYLNL